MRRRRGEMELEVDRPGNMDKKREALTRNRRRGATSWARTMPVCAGCITSSRKMTETKWWKKGLSG